MPTSIPGTSRPYTPGYAPGGRAISAETGRIGDMPGGMDYLAGIGPAPAGLSAADVQRLNLLSSTPRNLTPAALGQGSVSWGQSSAIRPALSAWNQANPNSQGLLGMFNAMNSAGVQNPGGDIGQWYQNGLWGGNNPFYMIATGRQAAPGSAAGSAFQGPAQRSSTWAAPTGGGLGASRNTAAYSGWSGFGSPGLSGVRPQGAFSLAPSPTTPMAGFSTVNDPWGLGGM